MSDKEAKLKAYRQKKKLNDLFNGILNKMKEFTKEDETQNKKRLLTESGSDMSDDDRGIVPDRDEIIADCDNDVSSIASNESTLIIDSWSKKAIAWYLAKVLIWILLFCAAVKVQFGAVFFAISLLIFIYFNTRTEKKKRGEVSAYSVFNKDCKPIEGSLQPEQLQREMLGGFFYNS